MVLFLDLVLVDERPKGTKTLRRPNSNFKPAHRPDYPEQLEASLCALMSVVLTDTEGTRTSDRTDQATLFSCQSPFLNNPTLLVLRLPSPQCSSSLYCFLFFFRPNQHIKLPAPTSPPSPHILPQTPPTFSPQLFPGTLAPRDSPLHHRTIALLCVLALCSPSPFSTF